MPNKVARKQDSHEVWEQRWKLIRNEVEVLQLEHFAQNGRSSMELHKLARLMDHQWTWPLSHFRSKRGGGR